MPETFTDNEITLKQTASSEEEAKIFIDTGLWPWDDFMIKSYTTTINNAYQVDRGYEKIEERLQKLGAEIRRVNPMRNYETRTNLRTKNKKCKDK